MTRIDSIHCVEDARRAAKKRMPRIIFDYVDGAAGKEQANARNQSELDNILLQPRALVNIENRSLTTDFLNQQWSCPYGIAPMGMCNLSWPGGDDALANVAAQHNLPVALSTMGSSTIEHMAETSSGNAWFQLYVSGTPDSALSLLDRAKVAGYQTLMLTVDVPEVAVRLRDQKNGFKVPFRIGPQQFLDFALHPRWSITTLLKGAPTTVNTIQPGSDNQFNRYAGRGAIDWSFLQTVRDNWQGNLLVKGILRVDDAEKVKSMGCDGLYLSNHGGRQLASAPAPIRVLPQVRNAVGTDFPIVIDSGFRCGEDIVKAYALGANFVMLGRPFLYALGAGGDAGVQRIVQTLNQETLNCMAQIGANNIAQIDSSVLAQ